MVVMFGEIFRELKSCEVVIGRHTSYGPHALEVDKMSIRRTSRNVRKFPVDVGDARGLAAAQKEFDDGAAPRGVSQLALS